MIRDLRSRLTRLTQRAAFERRISGVFALPPLVLRPAPLAIVSMVQPKDLAAYLLALRTLYSHIRRGNVVAILARRDMTSLGKQLKQHVPAIELVDIETVETGVCQRGGTWERLLYLCARAQREYVIQMDADTLVTGSQISEVLDCIERSRGFTIGGGPWGSGQQIVPFKQAAAAVDIDSQHICVETQRQLSNCRELENFRYVRGSSSFIGMAKGSPGRELVEKFHLCMEPLLGDRWREWGTEQCASNFVIANVDGAAVLPFPDYSNFNPDEPSRPARFVHYFGTYRYNAGAYAREGQGALARLQLGGGVPLA